MSKLPVVLSTVLIVVAAAVAIGSLVLNIIILGKVNDGGSCDSTATTSLVTDSTTNSPATDSVATTTTTTQPTPACPAYGNVSTKDSWKEAAKALLRGIDVTADPCQDFYQFACGRYIREATQPGQSSLGEAQTAVNLQIADYLDKLTDPPSTTENIMKTAYTACLADAARDPTDPAVIKEKLGHINADLIYYLGFPLFGVKRADHELTAVSELFSVMGEMERQYVGGPLLSSGVTNDYANKSVNALYVGQPALSYPRDYYVLPQFINQLQAYQIYIESILAAMSDFYGMPPKCTTIHEKDKCIAATAAKVVDMERRLAIASWPETELRNFKQQYNPYNKTDLSTRFPNIDLSSYIDGLTDVAGIQLLPFKIVITQPSYFLMLDALFASGEISTRDLVDFLAIQFLMSSTGTYGVGMGMHSHASLGIQPYVVRRGFGVRRIQPPPLTRKEKAAAADDGTRSYCVLMQIIYMMYAPGYTYTKLRTDRDLLREDIRKQTANVIAAFGEMIDTLPWMTDSAKKAAHSKSQNLVQNYLWPTEIYQDFKDTTNLDKYHVDYSGILTAKNYWETFKVLSGGMETREFIRQLEEPGNRKNFLQSPAMVNAWYQMERNSITLPMAALNPPFYSLQYPQAYNYAGQGGVGGHELTHGYDDQGVQFGPEGELANCEFTHCSIIDDNSRKGFVDMAQCVVTQYSGKCCPLKSGNVRCVNGATTQGENIADLGGEMAAYRAYAKLIAEKGEEDLLPGLTQFTPNQIFWLTHGNTWCSKTTDAKIANQLLLDPHSPSSCRVNQVVQDIPEFARDFGCKRGNEMYPQDADRCKVWIGF